MPAPTPLRLADIGSGPAALLRRQMIGQVRAVFNDQAKGERPVMRSDNALFDPGTPIWRVHGDVTSMMVGGVAALLLQMLHPAALAGVWDHSNFRDDMLGRLRRTARFIAVTTYGDRVDAEAAMARVRRIHDHVGGTLADGTPYRAGDPHLLAWVHVAEAIGFLDAWQKFGSKPLTRPEQDRYFAQFAQIARALGADPVPETRAAADALLLSYRSELRVDARTREVSRLILSQPPRSAVAGPVQAMLLQAAVDLLPPWAAAMHGLPTSRMRRPLVSGTTTGVARALRWAFATA
ncbi:oxygenase MpaB family protein [Sphingomonas qomolangmaensis]|uniref:DUF2236 domain-containing protein n=1 Tax=Sphingomonas qomolangmaensis TaxID=2918765 RepID=A0ABY5L525_9SPHN|nr:oxygenase MpaB family protein [Sphingomonas qomolangmaensis]UUL81261.1 DUF2236 domain-containing protein [Sphingomonas qomolangmaensis]